MVFRLYNCNVFNLSNLPQRYAACAHSNRVLTSSARLWIPFLQSIYSIDCSILNRSPEMGRKNKGESHRLLDEQNSRNSISRKIDCVQSKSAWDNVIEWTQLNQPISLSCRHGYRRQWYDSSNHLSSKTINFLSAEGHEQWARVNENPSQSIAILQQSETNSIRICVFTLLAQCSLYMCSSKCKHQLCKGPFRPFNKVPSNAFGSYTIELRTCVYSNRRYEMSFPIESNEWCRRRFYVQKTTTSE